MANWPLESLSEKVEISIDSSPIEAKSSIRHRLKVFSSVTGELGNSKYLVQCLTQVGAQ